MSEPNNDFITVNYECPYCGYSFEKELNNPMSVHKAVRERYKTQVIRCPSCKNYLDKERFI